MTIGYLCSEFPALSHTFISREIAILEQDGFTVESASINPTRNLDKMDRADQDRAAKTYVLKATSKVRILGLLVARFLNVPRFFGVLGYTLGLTWFKGPRDLAKSLAYFVQAILLDDWARRVEITHLHVHFANPAATVALIATRFGRLKMSLSVHGPDELYDVEKNNLKEKIEAAVFVRTIGHFCSSQLMRLSSVGQWNKFRIVRCGLYPGEFVRRPAAAGPAKRLLCVGRICPSKGQAILVRAAQELKRRGHSFELLLLGGGEDLEMVRTLVQTEGLADVITVAGPVGHSRVREELTKADVFVLPSFAEGIPVALMEAMAAGVPVVSTKIAGIPELIHDGVSGFLAEASNVAQLADILERFLKGQVDTASLTARAAEAVAQHFDVGTNTRALGQIFREMGN